MTQVFYTKHDGGLTLIVDGKQSTVSSTNEHFGTILEALEVKNYAKAIEFMNLANTINATGVSKTIEGCKIFVKDGLVYFSDTKNRKEVELHGSLVDRILRDLGKPNFTKYADSLIRLLDNIKKNPVKDISAELYEWLLSGKAPITSDGCILAYKKVGENFFDIYSRKFDNSPGNIVKIPQEKVDQNRNIECSYGLHFASLGYLSHYSGGDNAKVVIVKVNPRHIFAIPRDYNCQKGRCSEYFVVGEYRSTDKEKNEAFDDAFVDEDNMEVSAPDVAFTTQKLKLDPIDPVEPTVKPTEVFKKEVIVSKDVKNTNDTMQGSQIGSVATIGTVNLSLTEQARNLGLLGTGAQRDRVKCYMKDGKNVVVPWSTKESDTVLIKSIETKTVRVAIKEYISQH